MKLERKIKRFWSNVYSFKNWSLVKETSRKLFQILFLTFCFSFLFFDQSERDRKTFITNFPSGSFLGEEFLENSENLIKERFAVLNAK